MVGVYSDRDPAIAHHSAIERTGVRTLLHLRCHRLEANALSEAALPRFMVAGGVRCDLAVIFLGDARQRYVLPMVVLLDTRLNNPMVPGNHVSSPEGGRPLHRQIQLWHLPFAHRIDDLGVWTAYFDDGEVGDIRARCGDHTDSHVSRNRTPDDRSWAKAD